MATTNPLVKGYRAQVTVNIQDGVSSELMTKAVTLVPCGHNFNEDTIIQIMAREKLCPLDRTPIEKYVPNYEIRQLANTINLYPDEPQGEPPTDEAQLYFAKGKKAFDNGKNEEAIEAFLTSLQISPTYEKAQSFLEFCLERSKQLPPQKITAPTNTNPKNKFIDLLLQLIEKPSIQADPILLNILESQVEDLMDQNVDHLTPKEQESYKWTQKLLIEEKVSQFVAKKLQQIHQDFSQISPSKNQSIIKLEVIESPLEKLKKEKDLEITALSQTIQMMTEESNKKLEAMQLSLEQMRKEKNLEITALHQTIQQMNEEQSRGQFATILPSVKQLPLSNAGREKALLNAAATGDIEYARQLIMLETSVNSRNFKGETPLILAAINGHTAIAEMLIDNGSELDAERNESYFPPSGTNDIEMAKTAVEIATHKGHKEIVRKLVTEGAKLTREYYNKSLYSAAIIEAAKRGDTDIVDLFIKSGVDLCSSMKNIIGNMTLGDYVFHVAAINKHKELVQFLLSFHDNQPHSFDISNAINGAIYSNDPGILQQLLDKTTINLNSICRQRSTDSRWGWITPEQTVGQNFREMARMSGKQAIVDFFENLGIKHQP